MRLVRRSRLQQVAVVADQVRRETVRRAKLSPRGEVQSWSRDGAESCDELGCCSYRFGPMSMFSWLFGRRTEKGNVFDARGSAEALYNEIVLADPNLELADCRLLRVSAPRDQPTTERCESIVWRRSISRFATASGSIPTSSRSGSGWSNSPPMLRGTIWGRQWPRSISCFLDWKMMAGLGGAKSG